MCEPAQGLDKIKRLVQGFASKIQSWKSTETSEADVRLEYIDPFWKILGWDVSNKRHRSTAEKDVVVEKSITTIENQRIRSRRPDYLFRIDGFPKFILEAKDPLVDLATNRDAIFQAKTYAWSAQIPFAILMDFEEFRLFDTTIKPFHGQPNSGVIADFDLRFENYPTQWDILWKTFSREAVAKGSLEELLHKLKKVRKGRRIRGIDRMLIDLRGSEPVDKAFLAHLEDYRERFAKAMYRENKPSFPEANTRHGAAKLTEATQRLIDRLVFIRVCEDRDISHYGGLHDDVDKAVKENTDLYPIITARFRNMDNQYNGYLFKFHTSEELKIPSQLLADFIGSLYMPNGPYRFDAISDDILGIIYERFLGSVITVHRNQVQAEQKPEVRHAKGVYYTPRFVVDTIIRRVVGPQLKDRKPLDILDLKIVDPACGSGSFLIAAFQYLMDHCLTHFKHNPKDVEVPATPRARKKKKQLAFQDKEGEWYLAPDFKAQLLTSCIHGVDIDAQAVEVTIMSLYLKMLEGKLPDHWQRDWLENQLLPPLDNNIHCGNSLLSHTEFDLWWENEHASLFDGDADVKFRLNAFDWDSHTRGFGRIFDKKKGFDAIVGNPPYIRVQELNKWAPDECEFYKKKYKSAAKGNYDIYVVFIERALQLLAPTGLMGFITPHKYWQAKYGEGLRKIIAKGKHLKSVIDFTDQQVFKGATTYTAIQVLNKEPIANEIDYAMITQLDDGELQCFSIDRQEHCDGTQAYTAQHPLMQSDWRFQNRSRTLYMSRIQTECNIKLSDMTERMYQGIRTSMNNVYVLEKTRKKDTYYSKAISQMVRVENDLLRPFLRGEDIRRYAINDCQYMVLIPYQYSRQTRSWTLIDKGNLKSDLPHTWRYLTRCEQTLRMRERGKMDCDEWYGYVYPKNLDMFGTRRIIVRDIIERGSFTVDEDGRYAFVSGYGYVLKDIYITQIELVLGLLNSSLLTDYLKQISTPLRGGWYRTFPQYVGQLPIKLPKTSEEKKLAKRVIDRVKRIIETKKKLQAKKLGQHERERFERQVEADESAIDELVCQLYGVDEIPEI